MRHPIICFQLNPGDVGYCSGARYRCEDREGDTWFFASRQGMFRWISEHGCVWIGSEEMASVRKGLLREDSWDDRSRDT